MLRKLFWILLAAGVGAVIWFSANSRHMTASQNLLFWTLVVDVVLVALTGFPLGMLTYGIRKGSVILASRRGGREFSRATEPVRYWLTMTYYLCWALLGLYAFYARNRELWQWF